MAKAKRIKTRHAIIYKVGDRYEWKLGNRARGTADTLSRRSLPKPKPR